MTYSEYKSSGVDWIDDVPTDWFITPNKYLFVITKDLVGDKSNEYQLLSLTQKGVIFRDIESGKGKFPAKFDSYQVVQENNLIFCLFDIEETPRAVGISKHFGMITGAYTVVVCNNRIEPKFLYYYYLQMDNDKRLKPYYTGLRNTVRTDTFLSLKVPHPPLQEQQQIANFLDHKTQQVDSLIEKTQQKIELLKEQRTALVNQVVTKGLDPDAEMKDSGVEWIGEIPVGWEASKLKFILLSNDGGVFGQDAEEDDDWTIVLRSTEITIDGYWDLSNPMKRLLTKNEFEKHQLFEGDIVLVKSSGSQLHIGKSAIVSKEIEELGCCFANFVQRIRFSKFDSNLAHYILNSHLVREQYRYQTQSTTGLGNLNSTCIGEMIFPYIPLQEQQEIVEYLDNKTQQFDSQVVKENKRIELLKEYRNALISEVVTGKIDVREEMVA